MKTINEYKPESVSSPYEFIEEIIKESDTKCEFLEHLLKTKPEIKRDIAEKNTKGYKNSLLCLFRFTIFL